MEDNPYVPPSGAPPSTEGVLGTRRPPSSPFAPLDWVLTACAVGGIVALVVFPMAAQRSFASMFQDFGSQSKLPLLTRFALSGWFGPLLAFPAVCSLSGLLSVRRRRWVI